MNLDFDSKGTAFLSAEQIFEHNLHPVVATGIQIRDSVETATLPMSQFDIKKLPSDGSGGCFICILQGLQREKTCKIEKD